MPGILTKSVDLGAKKLKTVLLFLLLSTPVFAYIVPLTSFNTGQVSRLMEARAKFAKYSSSCRTLENMLVTAQGPVLKRPGTKYIATAKAGSVRLLPFEFSTDDAYVLEAGNLYFRYYRDGGQILDPDDPVEDTTVFDADEIWDIRYAQVDDQLYLVDGTDPPQVLTRAEHYDWTIEDVTFETGPFLPENETTTTIATAGYSFADNASAETFTITGSGDLSTLFPDDGTFTVGGSTDNDGSWTVSSTNATDPFVITVTGDITGTDNSGTIVVQGGTVTLTASAAVFSVLPSPTHVGSIWQINQVRGSSTITGTFTDNGTSLSTPFFSGDYGFTTDGNDDSTITLQRSTNNGISWRAALVALTDTDFDNPAEFEEDGAIYRVVCSAFGSGTPDYTITITDNINKGVVKITAVASTTSATATVVTNLVDTDAVTTWREGYWSDFRGWPKTVAFHQQRLVFGGSDSYPQVIWFGKQDPDDYANFLESTLDTSAFTMALEGQNPIRWLLSQEYLLIGSSGSCGKWGAQGEAATPTSPNYQRQTPYGAAAFEAIQSNSGILYVERGSRRIREFGYKLQSDKFESDDVTVLSPEITDSGIKDIAFQLRPDPILWCVLNNGDIATMTYEKNQAVIAWTKQVTDGDFESVVVISSGADEDEVWVSVERNAVRYIEQFQPRDWGDDQEDAWFVDSGLDYDSTATATFTGLDHLDDETVAVWADGIVQESEVVIGGEITIDLASARVISGLPYTAKLETMPMRVDPQDYAMNKKIKRLWIDFYKTGDMEFGPGPDSDLTTVSFWVYDGVTVSAYQDLYTSRTKLKQFAFPYAGFVKQTVYLQSSKPVPLGVRAIIAEVEIRN